MSKPSATIIVGAAGAIAFVAIIIALIWLCKSHCKNFSNKNSETGSSDPSAQEWNRGGPSSTGGHQPPFGPQAIRQFSVEDLEQATKHFSDSNLIGYGSFGPVYKGLLRDTVVAIKRRSGAPRQALIAEATHLSEIRHRHIVSLLGYCQENGYQMLVYEYLPNGNMCSHLYDTGLESSTRLEFKQRLSIAIGAARGLWHFHCLKPPLIHKNFKTANVLVDEDFHARVADAGILKLLEQIEEAGPSHPSGNNVFQDPEIGILETFTEISDVYSFGVFLFELVTGKEVVPIGLLGSNEGLYQLVRSQLSSNSFVDHRLLGSFTAEGIRDLIRLTIQCMSFPGRDRPKMDMVVHELERIHEKEMALTTVMGEGTAIITLGSELFMSK